MYGDGDVEAKSVVIEDVDAKEKKNVEGPSKQGNPIWLEVKGRMGSGEVVIVACEGYEKELSKGNQKT